MSERRVAPRVAIDMLFNKYLGGRRYRCRAVDVSAHGLRAQSFEEPERQALAFPVELCVPGDDRGLWVWSRRVWQRGREQALQFLTMHERDRRRLDRYLDFVR
jgi:hypothetical protein